MRTEDGYIVYKCLEGDSSAFGFLVDKYKGSVYAHAYSRLRNFHDAEDITQEVFINAYRKLHTLRRWDSVMAWLYSITFNLCKLRIRSRSRQPDNEFIEDQDPDTLDRPSIDHYQEESIFRSLDDALNSLPEIHREILTLHYLAGMKVMDMARYLGTSPRTIARRLNDARSQLKEEMITMVETSFEGQKLSARFTIRIVEIVKRIRVNPFSQTKGLPWGLSLATSILFAVLGLHTNLSFFNINDVPADSLLSSQTIVQKVGEFPVKALRMSQVLNISGNLGNGKSDFSGNQNFALMAPKGEGGKIPDKPSAQLGKGVLGGMAYSPDGKILAVSTGLGIRLYDANNLNEIGILQEDKPYAGKIAFSPDGNILAGYIIGEGISLWDMQTQKLMGLIPDGQGFNMAFSPDIKILAVTGWQDNNIHLWDIQKMEQIGLLQGHTAYVRSFEFTPDGKTLVSGSNDKTIRLWDIQEQKQIGLFEGKNGVWNIAISPDGRTLASGGGEVNEGELLLWNIQEQKLIVSLKGHNSAVTSIAISPDGKILASGDIESTIRIWDIQEQKQIELIQGNEGEGRLIAFNPDGKTLASSDGNYEIRFWDIQEQKKVGMIDGFTPSVFSVAFSPDGKIIASEGYKKVLFWDLTGQKQIGDGASVEDNLVNLIFSPDGKILAGSSYESKTISLIDVQEQKQIGLLKGHTGEIQSLAFSPDSKILASGGGPDMTLRVWDVQKQKEIQMFICASYAHSVAFTPDGKYLACAIGGEMTIRLWNVNTWKQADVIQTPGAMRSIAFSPDGKMLAAGDESSITFWDFTNKELLETVWVGNNIYIWHLMFSPDSKWLASQSNDWTCRIWDAQTREQLANLKGYNEFIYNMAFSPDGKWLATCGIDGTIRLWEVDIPVQGKAINPMGKATGTWGDVKKNQLFQNYPNPFNPETWIPYQLGEDTESEIKIYTSNGQLVRKLDLGKKQAGSYINQENAAYWDGKNEAGECVSSGVYYYTIQAGEYSATKKMVVAR